MSSPVLVSGLAESRVFANTTMTAYAHRLQIITKRNAKDVEDTKSIDTPITMDKDLEWDPAMVLLTINGLLNSHIPEQREIAKGQGFKIKIEFSENTFI